MQKPLTALPTPPTLFGQGAAGWKPGSLRNIEKAAASQPPGSGQRQGAAVWQVAAGWVQSTPWAAAHGPRPPRTDFRGDWGAAAECGLFWKNTKLQAPSHPLSCDSGLT